MDAVGQPEIREAASARAATELLASVLAEGDGEIDRETFYSRLAEGVARVAGMSRVVVFRFDEVLRRVDAAGAFGIDLSLFADVHVSLDAAPTAAVALLEDRVIEIRPPAPHLIPDEFAAIVGDHPLVYVPVAAGGRWPGVIIAEPVDGAPPLDDARREWLWTLGKTLALASIARIATFDAERAQELQRRIDLVRELHERVVQRLFGVAMALSPSGPLGDEARERCADELEVALGDLHAAMQRPLRASPRVTGTTLRAEIVRLASQPHDFELTVAGAVPALPAELEPLVQSVFAEAVRNVRKHAAARSLTVRVRRGEGLVSVEVENDGVVDRPRRVAPGVGLRIAALEALQMGGVLEFGERQPGFWQVRLSVPEGTP